MKRIALQSILMVAFATDALAVEWLDNGDRSAIDNAAQDSLEYANTQESTEWINPDTGSRGTFTPTATLERSDGQICREYTVRAIIGGREEQVYGTACRMSDGSWMEANRESAAYDPPDQSSEWAWVPPRISVSGSYCDDGLCIGGSYGFPYYSWYSPISLDFSYWGRGYGNHYRPHRNRHHYGYYRHDPYRRGYGYDRHYKHHRGSKYDRPSKHRRGSKYDRPSKHRRGNERDRHSDYQRDRSGRDHHMKKSNSHSDRRGHVRKARATKKL